MPVVVQLKIERLETVHKRKDAESEIAFIFLRDILKGGRKMDELLTVDEVAKIARASRVTVYSWAKNGLIPVIRRLPQNNKRARIFFRREDVLALFSSDKNILGS